MIASGWARDDDIRVTLGRLHNAAERRRRVLAGRAADLLVYLRYHLTAARRFHEPPILIGGCGRSGTTLLQAILSASHKIYVFPGETYAFSLMGYTSDPSRPFRFDWPKIYRQLIAVSASCGTCDRWCEKSPKNVLFFERIIKFFSGRVRLIHIVRDGRDVITSVHPKNPSGYWVSKDRWVQDVSAGLRLEKHPCVLTLRYEDLILDHARQLERICAFVGVPCDERMRDWQRHAAIRRDEAWFDSLRLPDASSIGRWRGPQHRAVVEDFMRDGRAVELLRHFRYLE